jgi:hypothetical protein
MEPAASIPRCVAGRSAVWRSKVPAVRAAAGETIAMGRVASEQRLQLAGGERAAWSSEYLPAVPFRLHEQAEF